MRQTSSPDCFGPPSLSQTVARANGCASYLLINLDPLGYLNSLLTVDKDVVGKGDISEVLHFLDNWVDYDNRSWSNMTFDLHSMDNCVLRSFILTTGTSFLPTTHQTLHSGSTDQSSFNSVLRMPPTFSHNDYNGDVKHGMEEQELRLTPLLPFDPSS
ncbi:hypothetical protein BJ508DRAFT_335481 [Ascobolus immersus RN42]|uniref:Uncharacterized protein n=1 Tax=Ascobolus immersus RN42 TaxID=1160509 RepID=A0A3N4HGQ1_ASCIM|nr:hypothetical protein BJ508DRAFT_335481 [Ascobolus immersus RN42]